jgi:predicted negative regulator of RcsB-dependent stress response
VDRAHRRELKHDKFIEQVGHSVDYAADHKSQIIKYGAAVVIVLIAVFGWYFYSNQQRAVRQQALRDAMRVQEAQIGPSTSQFVLSFPSEAEKDKAVEKAFTELSNKYSGSAEGAIARYFLGIAAADDGKLAEAEKHFKAVAETGDETYASQAKLSLAQVYEATGRAADAEKLLRSMIDDPTILVSKEQATIALGRLLAKTKPEEARKLLEPLRTERGPVSRAAISALGEMSR